MKKLTALFLLTLCIVLGCISCSKQVKYKAPQFKEEVVGSFELIGEELYGFQGTIQSIDEYKSYLIILALNFDNRSYIHIYDKNSGELILETLYDGRGSKECLYVSDNNFDRNTGIYHIHDWRKPTYITFQIDSLIKNPVKAIQEEAYINQPGLNRILENDRKIIRYFNPSYVETDTSTMQRLVIEDKESGNLFSYNGYPIFEDDVKRYYTCGIPNFRMDADPDFDKLVVATYYGNILETFDISGPIKELGRKYYINPAVSGIGWNDQMQLGWTDIFATKSFIYGVYDGENYVKKLFDMPEESRPLFDNNIVKFDWSGIALKKIKTDYRIERICVNESENIVYAVALDKEGALYLAKLKM